MLYNKADTNLEEEKFPFNKYLHPSMSSASCAIFPLGGRQPDFNRARRHTNPTPDMIDKKYPNSLELADPASAAVDGMLNTWRNWLSRRPEFRRGERSQQMKCLTSKPFTLAGAVQRNSSPCHQMSLGRLRREEEHTKLGQQQPKSLTIGTNNPSSAPDVE
jgi:hypothetical protein